MTGVLVGLALFLAGIVWWCSARLVGAPAVELGVRRATLDPDARRPSLDRWFGARRRRQGAEAAEMEALELLDGLAPALRSGLPPVTALRLVSSSRTRGSPHRSRVSFRAWGRVDGPDPAVGDWTALADAAARGDPLAPAWSAYAAAVDSDDLRLVAAAWFLCETLGSPLAPTVTTVADLVRRRRAVRHRIATALAGPQATMRVLTALPLSGPFVAVAVGVSPSELYAGAAGASSLLVGLLLLGFGRLWAARMVRAVEAENTTRLPRPRKLPHVRR